MKNIEKKVFEIINSDKDRVSRAKEISALLKDHYPKAFVEWLIEEPLIVRTGHNTWEVYKNQENYEWGDPYEEMNIDELFDYWCNLPENKEIKEG